MLMAVLKAKEEITLGNKFVVIHSFLSSVNNLICSGPILVTLMEASDLWLSWIMGCESGTFSSWKNITGNYKIQDGGLSYCSNSQDMVSWGLLWVMQGSPLDLNISILNVGKAPKGEYYLEQDTIWVVEVVIVFVGKHRQAGKSCAAACHL